MKKRNTTYRLNKVDYAIFIIFSIAAAAMLFLFYRDLNSFTIKQSEEPVAKIYFKRNTAQRKFIDNDIWEVLTNSSDIYDGDRIRTSKNSEAYTEFSDSGIQIQLREKSMVQIFKNKKQRSVDFIGGEIFVANNSPEEKLVIHSGKKEIAVSQASEVKLALPEVSEAVASGEEESSANDNTVLIEVISGQVEVIEEPIKTKKEKNESKEPVPIIVSAGETVTLAPVITTPAVEVVEKVEEPVTEPVAEPVIELADIEEPVLEEPVVDKAVVEKTVVENPPVRIETVAKKPLPPQPIKAGTGKTVSAQSAYFRKSVYNNETGQYNYAYGFNLEQATEKNMSIPAGAVLEVTMAGIPNNDLSQITIQFSTGEEEWKQAHMYWALNLNKGAGLKKDVPFEEKYRVVTTYPIVNTNSSWVNIDYEPRILDKAIIIKNFDVSFKVLTESGGLKPKTIAKGYKTTLEYDQFALILDKWGEGEDDYDYRLRVDANDVFGDTVKLPAGTKIKISVSGKPNIDFNWCFPEIFYIVPYTDREGEEWRPVILPIDDQDHYKYLRFNEDTAKKNRQFNYSKEFTVYQELGNTDNGLFQFTIGREDFKQKPAFEDLKFTFEITEVGQ